jgi:catalase
LKFPDFIHSQKRDPRTGYKNAIRMWDYWSQAPEAMHQITILFSDRGIPDGYRHMNGYGSHTFSLWNNGGERFWVKFHFKSMQGIKNLPPEKAAQLAGTDPDYAGRDLFEAIEAGQFPRWKMMIQIMPELDAERLSFNPFDLTKVWPHNEYPLQEVGILELNRNPENYFAEVEQAAFSPANVPPGIGYSPDKMLQARLFAYPDAARYRIGVNYQSLPVNRPLNQVTAYHRDGGMRFDSNGGRVDNYEPNGFNGPAQDESVTEPPLRIRGDAFRYDAHRENDDFTQAGNLYRILTVEERERLTDNIAAAMRGVPDAILRPNIEHFLRCDQDYGLKIAAKVRIKM